MGPARAELLERLGVRTVADLLFFFPRDYQDLTDLRSIASLEEDRFLSIRGVVEESELRGSSPGRSVLGVLVRDEKHYLRALWFNQPYMADKFKRGQQVLMSGKAAMRGGRWEMHHPRVQWIDPDEPPPTGQVLPIYPLTEGLTQGNLRTIVRSALAGYPELIEEIFPPEFLARKQLWSIQQAVAEIHFPSNSAQAFRRQRCRFAYQELFLLQLALAVKRQAQIAAAKSPSLAVDARIDSRIRRLFPFELTAAQQRVIGEIMADMARTTPMNRLLQGDVGSGKTVVAFYAALVAIAHGYQVAVMAPTEILARQHARTFGRWLAGGRVRLATLTGAVQGVERETLQNQIAAGEVDLVVGTQAIVRSDARFKQLGLIVIDEQHKFGVRQRALLKQAGADPHCLIMTATPIPRTLTMTLYGDLDVSALAELPPGRQPLRTYLAGPAERAKWWDFVRRKLREGRQAYMIVPLVEQGVGRENFAPIASIEETFENLAHGELEAFRLGLVHGRMDGG